MILWLMRDLLQLSKDIIGCTRHNQNKFGSALGNKNGFSIFSFAQALAKITDYCESNTSAFIARTKTLETQQQFNEALALLTTY